MTKTELIALTNQVREKIEKLRAEMTEAVDKTGESEGDMYEITYEEECFCDVSFNNLMAALDDFAQLLTQEKDLPPATLVMCKFREADGWQVQQYWQKGATQTSMGDNTIHSGWLYVVPLKYFHPTSADWRPDEKYNWANFEEGEK